MRIAWSQSFRALGLAVSVALFGCAAGASAAPLAREAPPAYSIRIVNFPGFVKAGTIAGVGAHGEMAGVGSETGNSYPDCVYSDGARLVDLTYASGNFCHFSAMNAHGVAVGQYYDFSGYLNYAVLYANRTFTTINKSIDSFLAFNDEGLAVANLPVAGFAVYAVGARKIVYVLYDRRESCGMAFPYAINDKGVVFGYDQCEGGNVRYETVSNGIFSYFQAPPGYALTMGVSGPVFDNSNRVALTKTGSGHAFLWGAGKQISPLDLGALADDPNGVYTVTALTDRTAVGITSDGYSWIWTSRRGMQNLAQLLPPNSFGWIQPQALDVEGDIGCSVAGDDFTWLYLRRNR